MIRPRRMAICCALVLVWNVCSWSLAQEAANSSDAWIRRLEEFGPTGTAQEAQQTWRAAREALQDKAGILVVPARV